MNLATVIVGMIVFILCAAAAYFSVKNSKKGSSCGGSCSACGSSCSFKADGENR